MNLRLLFIFVICYFGSSEGNSAKTLQHDSEECGIKTKPDSEGYGRDPWHVSIYRIEQNPKHRNICGGTIIHPKFVLTVAHCLYLTHPDSKDFNSSIFRITAGKIDRDFNKEEKYQQIVNLAGAALHKDYAEVKSNFGNDIAIIKVDPPFKITDQVSPVCIDKANPPFSIQPNELGTIAVWNSKKSEEEGTLDELHLSTLTRTECIPIVEKYNITYPDSVTPDKLCLVHEDKNGPEYGTAGAGIIFDKNGKNYIVGIVSVAFAGEKRMSTLTNVRYHLDWITNYMKHNN